MTTQRNIDLYEEQEFLENGDLLFPEDYLPTPIYRNDDWLNEIDEEWIEEWEDEC